MRHAHALVAALVDDREARSARGVSGIRAPYLVQEPPVDLVDDLERPWQQAREQRQPPGLESLGQQRVIRIRERAAREVPRLVPRHEMLVDEQPHELGDGDRRVRVVQLYGGQLWQPGDRLALHREHPQHVLQRARHEEVLLREPQPLADLGIVVRIQYLGERLRHDFLAHGAVVIADVEVLEVERLDGLAAPEPQGVAVVHVIAEYRYVGRYSPYAARRHPANTVSAEFVGVALGAPPEIHVPADVRPHDLPGVAVLQPFVGGLHLPAVANLLIEDPELVTNAVPDGGHPERRERVEIARGETAQAAVTQAWFFFELEQRI